MDEKEAINLLNAATAKIEELRRQNEIMQARLSMFDDMRQLLFTQPAMFAGGGMEPDIVYSIKSFVKKVEAENNDKALFETLK